MIKLIIFDYDGVIVDSFSNVHKVYQIICSRLGKECSGDIDEFRKFYGHTSTEAKENLGLNDKESVEANKIFKEEIMKLEPQPFDGIAEVVKELSEKYKLIVISSNYKDEVEMKLEKIGIREYFDEVIGAESPTDRMPKGQAIKKAVSDRGVSNDEALMIGDRRIDYLEGKEAGLSHILLVEYGWGYDISECDGYERNVIVEKPVDLITGVEKFEN